VQKGNILAAFVRYTHPDWDMDLIVPTSMAVNASYAIELLADTADKNLLQSTLLMRMPNDYLSTMPEFSG
jgi:hypothetical protein